jgi:hypothetical protein
MITFAGIYTTTAVLEYQREHPNECDFRVNPYYALISSTVSFWLPCTVMLFTYWRIYLEATKQEKMLYKSQMIIPHHHHHHKSRAKSTSGPTVNHSAVSVDSGAGNGAARRCSALTSAAPISDRNNNSPPAIVGADEKRGAALPLPLPSAPTVSLSSNALSPSGSAVDSTLGDGTSNVLPTTPASVSASGSLGAHSHMQINTNCSSHATHRNSHVDDTESGQSTPTKRNINKMRREHKAAKTLGTFFFK